MKKNLFTLFALSTFCAVAYAQTGNVGINTATPGTTLDVNGAITNRETAVAVASNAATVPANISQVRLTGSATAIVAITAPAAPNAGQRLIVYNNTTGGFGATLNGFTIPNAQALEFTYSNGGWRATNGGAAIAGAAWNLLGNTGTSPAVNFLGTIDNQDMVFRTNNTEKARIKSNGYVGVGTNNPKGIMHVVSDNVGLGAANDIYFDGYGTSKNPSIFLSSSGGTEAAPTALNNGDMVGSMYFNPRLSSGWPFQSASISSLYKGDGTTNLTDMRFNTSTVDRVIIDEKGNMGVGTMTPGTTLDVDGAITNRETAVAVASNAATVPANRSQVQLTGSATAIVAITAPAAPNAGQRLIIYNNTTGGFGATLNGFTIPNAQAIEFAYSNGGWRATNGGASTPAGTAWNLLGNAGTNPATNFLGTTDNQDMVMRTNNTEKMRVASGGNVGIGTIAAPLAKLDVVGQKFGLRNGSGSGSWDNIWLDVSDTSAPTINVSGAETGLQFRVGANGAGTYGDGQTFATVATMTPTGRVGINTATPGTTLDVDGAITNRESLVAVASNAATVPANRSQVQLTGSATATVAITAPAALIAGQRLIVYNNTTGGFGATLNGFTIPNAQALEFTYSNGGWRSTNGGESTPAGTAWNLLGNAGTNPATNFLGTTDNQDMVFRTNNTEKARVKATGDVGFGTNAPARHLHLLGTGGPGSSSMLIENTGAIQASVDFKNSLRYWRLINDNAGNFGVHDDTAALTRITVAGGTGNVGLSTTTPVTTLDVNGAITNRESLVPVASNVATVPVNISQVRLTGSATATVAITAPAAPIPGQRLIVYNNTTGGFGATLNGFTIPNAQALEFTYSNGGWRSTNGGESTPAGTAWNLLGNAGTNPATNFLGTTDNQDMVMRTNNTEKVRVKSNGYVGVGTNNPKGIMHVVSDNVGMAAANDIYFDGYGTSKNPSIFLSSSGGTEAAPTALSNGDMVGSMYFNPRLSSGWPFQSASISSLYKGNGTTNLTDMRFNTSTVDRVIIDEKGNMGVGTMTPATNVNIINAGAGGATVTTTATANTALQLENSVNGQAVIQNLVAKSASGVATKVSMGVNPTTSTNGSFLITRSNGSDFMMDLANGHIGIGVASDATAQLYTNGTAGAGSALRIVDGTQGLGKILVSDANGRASWAANEVPILTLKPSSNQIVLASTLAGFATTLVGWTAEINTISGATFSGSSITLPQGTYEVTEVFEFSGASGTCPALGFLINSYYVEMPNMGSTIRIHANSPSNCGDTTSNHAASWRTTITIPAGGQSTTISVGRGIGGNYRDAITLAGSSSRIIYKKIF